MMMERIVVNFWAWSNICTDGAKGIINGFNRCCSEYGHAYKTEESWLLNEIPDNPRNVDYYFRGRKIAETEKAICFEVPCFSFNHRCDITKSYNWKIWIPKKCIITEDRYLREKIG